MIREPASAPDLLWRNSGEPPHKYREEAAEGPCATCAAPLDGHGIPTREVNSPTFSNHAEFFRYSAHVCRACAWLYGIGKGRPGNVLAVGNRILHPMISLESAEKEGRPSWQEILPCLDLWTDPMLGDLQDIPEDAPFCGVLTTDPKPRLWPRMRLSTARSPALYVHAPDYGASEIRALDVGGLSRCWDLVVAALEMGFSKRAIYRGLPSDYARMKRRLEEAMGLEGKLREYRQRPEFVPALVISGIEKGEKGGDDDADGGPEPGGEAGGGPAEDGDRLF